MILKTLGLIVVLILFALITMNILASIETDIENKKFIKNFNNYEKDRSKKTKTKR